MSEYKRLVTAATVMAILFLTGCSGERTDFDSVCDKFLHPEHHLGTTVELSLVVVYADRAFVAPSDAGKKTCPAMPADLVAIFDDPIFLESRDISTDTQKFGVEFFARGKFVKIDPTLEMQGGEIVFLVSSYKNAKIVRADSVYDDVFVDPPASAIIQSDSSGH